MKHKDGFKNEIKWTRQILRQKKEAEAKETGQKLNAGLKKYPDCFAVFLTARKRIEFSMLESKKVIHFCATVRMIIKNITKWAMAEEDHLCRELTDEEIDCKLIEDLKAKGYTLDQNGKIRI